MGGLGASKLLHQNFTCDLSPRHILYILLQNATPSPFLTRFWFCLLYVIALGEGFKTSTQNFDLWLLWPLTLIFDLYCTLATKCFSSAISILILIPFASCDSTRWGLQNFYAEFWPLTFIFDLCILYIGYKNATLPFATWFRFRLLYVIALSEGFKTSTQNFDLWPLWPFIFYIDLYYMCVL